MAKLSAAMKITKAKASLIMGHPFFGVLSTRLKVKEDPTCETAWCDGVSLGYNPKFIEDMEQECVNGLVAHEVMHPAMLHHTRRGAREARKWNMAADYAINPILNKAGFKLPPGGLDDPAFHGMSVDEIYNKLPDLPPGDGSGSGADPGGCGEVRDGKNKDGSEETDSQKAANESEWKVAVAQAAHVAKQEGKLPAGMDRVIEDLLEPVLPWKDILRRFMTEKSNDDFTWRRPNRRFIHQGIYLPNRQSEDSAGVMAVMIDTSGSIGQKELDEFGGEINGIHKDVRPKELIVIYCDAAVNHVDRFGPEDQIELHPHGGGGTDFRPPFDWLVENDIEVKCAVYLTDGYGTFPEDPGYPTMWAINNEQVVPPLGEHLIFSV